MRTILILFTVFLSSYLSRPANAQSFTWIDHPSGLVQDYETSSNWSPAGPPGVNGTANFTATFAQVIFNSNPTNHAFNVENGIYFFNGGNRIYTLLGTSQIDNGGSLESGVQLDLGGLFYVGRTGVGGFSTSFGNTINTFETTGLGTRIGEEIGSNGRATITRDANWTNVGLFIVGNSGQGTLNVNRGGRLLNVPGSIFGARTVLGAGLTGNGTANIDGAGSRWQGIDELFLGDAGNATVVISDGGFVSNRTASLGRMASGNGSVTVTGNGSAWINNGALEVGRLGRGTLNITDGGSVQSQGLTLAGGSGAVGTVFVNGTGSSLNASGITRIGSVDGGVGLMNIGTGGFVSTSALQFGTNGTLVLDGGTLQTGSISSLSTSNQGQLRFQSGTLHLTGILGGEHFSALGHSIDLSPNKSLIVDNALFVASENNLSLSGGNLFAEVLILTGGSITGPGTLDLPTMTGNNRLVGTGGIVSTSISGNVGSEIVSFGDLSLGNLSSSTGFEFGGTLDVGGNSVILHDSNNAVLGVDTILDGGRLISINGIELQSGNQLTTLSTTGENSLIDGAFTNNGTVHGATTEGDYLIFTDDVDGAGSFTGNVLFSDAFNPGNSPGVVSLENILLDSSSTLGIELAGIDFGQFDMLDISGDAVLEGALDVSLINGFELGASQEFLILDIDGSVTGLFAGFGEGDLVGNFGGRDLFISYSAGNGNDVALFTAVPEPAAMTVVTMAFLMTLIGYRRKRK